MKIVSVREFRDHASEWLRSEEPMLVVRRGEVVGIFFPSPGASLPIELKRELFPLFSEQVRLALERGGVTEVFERAQLRLTGSCRLLHTHGTRIDKQ